MHYEHQYTLLHDDWGGKHHNNVSMCFPITRHIHLERNFNVYKSAIMHDLVSWL